MSLCMVNLCLKLNLTYFAFILSYIYICGSGSTKLLNTDPDPLHWLEFCTVPVTVYQNIQGPEFCYRY